MPFYVKLSRKTILLNTIKKTQSFNPNNNPPPLFLQMDLG